MDSFRVKTSGRPAAWSSGLVAPPCSSGSWLSAPVEMDENLDLSWPPGGPAPGGARLTDPPEGDLRVESRRGLRREDGRFSHGDPHPHLHLRGNFDPPASRCPPELLPFQDATFHPGRRSWNRPEERSLEDEEPLEPPLPLISTSIPRHAAPPGTYGGPSQEKQQGPLLLRPPAPGCRHLHLPRGVGPAPGPRPPQDSWDGQRPQVRAPPEVPGPSEAEVVGAIRRNRADPGPGPATRTTTRTISLPQEYRNLFITYSVDTAEDIIPFTKFLTDQGFKPAIDLFDNPMRRMDITRWMDRYLRDKSILIIVVISPKYKEDVEGHGDDEHGLHTKYIHNQIQNEFIQQGCLNFRLVPVLFPNASKKHVPAWLHSTRIYSWPEDVQDLLLRLVREERYIIPPPGGALTLTVRPL